MFTLLFFAFVSGIITILAPCIWPLLPLLLSASVGEGRRRPLGIVSGIVTSFTIFTLFLSHLLQVLPIPPDAFRTLAAVIIIVLGLTLLVPALNRMLEGWVSKFSGKFGSPSSEKKGFWGGYGTGILLGLLWSPCAGPILAAVATLAATRAVTFEAFLVTLAFAVGVGIPLFVIARLGQKFFAQSRKLSPYTARIQQVFGVIMIAAAVLILTNADKTLQTKLLDAFPSYGSFLSGFEENETVTKSLNELQNKDQKNVPMTDIKKENSLDDFGAAPEFMGITHWIGTDGKELSLQKDLRGKVVLVDFWTYSCINCIRTLPFVTGWYEKYKDDGFVVVGVHTPEFAFEQVTENVEKAMKQYGINYPVAQDNNYATWRAYNNRYWPAHYLIDANGTIRYEHFGEGKYDETEKAIQTLLEEAGSTDVSTKPVDEDAPPKNEAKTPETYLGAGRMEYYSPGGGVGEGMSEFTLPSSTPKDSFSYGGTWDIAEEYAASGSGAVLREHFSAGEVYLVMNPGSEGTATVRLMLDGKPIEASVSGADVKNGTVTVDSDRLYHLVDLGSDPGDHVLELQFDTVGTQVFAFAFG